MEESEIKVNTHFRHIEEGAPYREILFKSYFTHPFTSIISGPSNSGKTTFICNLINKSELLIEPKLDRIIYVYSHWQSLFDTLKNVEFLTSVPNLSDYDSFQNTLIIIDDFMSEIDQLISSYFTRGSHHKNVSVMLVTQNLFHPNKHFRTASLNSQYMIIFKNPRDSLQIKYLARSIFDRDSKRFLEAYTHATTPPFGYILIDLRQHTHHNYRLRTWVLNDHPQGKHHQAVYFPKE